MYLVQDVPAHRWTTISYDPTFDLTSLVSYLSSDFDKFDVVFFVESGHGELLRRFTLADRKRQFFGSNFLTIWVPSTFIVLCVDAVSCPPQNG
jgi:hypothetical protein